MIFFEDVGHEITIFTIDSLNFVVIMYHNILDYDIFKLVIIWNLNIMIQNQ